jgi:hypothetical protein
MEKKSVHHNTVTHRVTKKKKTPETFFLAFCIAADKIFGELYLLKQIEEEYEDGFFSKDYYFGNKNELTETKNRITICVPEYSHPLIVIESSDYNQIIDVLGISGKDFRMYFKLWFFEKFPSLKLKNYQFVLSSPFLDF